MRPSAALFVLVLVASVGCAGAPTDATKIQGAWDVTEASYPLEVGPVKFVFSGNTLTTHGPVGDASIQAHAFRFSLDPVEQPAQPGKPRAIDFFPTQEDQKGQTLRGIYEFNGETLKLFLPSLEGRNRPDAFGDFPRRYGVTVTLKRAIP